MIKLARVFVAIAVLSIEGKSLPQFMLCIGRARVDQICTMVLTGIDYITSVMIL